jgi:hypothetical protein
MEGQQLRPSFAKWMLLIAGRVNQCWRSWFGSPCNCSLWASYGGPGQKSPDYSVFGQITGLCPCRLQAPSATRLAGQPAVQG